MIHRSKLKIAGARLNLQGVGAKVAPWRSADSDGAINDLNRTQFCMSRLIDGYFGGTNRARLPTTSTGGTAGRSTTYRDTGWKDVAVEGTFFGLQELSALPAVKVNPAVWEHSLSPFAEQWLNLRTGSGFWVIWCVARPASIQCTPVTGGNIITTPGTPLTVRAEVVGRRMKAFYSGNNSSAQEYIVPKLMADSTSHGVTHDILYPYQKTRLNAGWGARDGNWNPATGEFPHIKTTDSWVNVWRGDYFVSNGTGTVNGVSFVPGDKILCLTKYGNQTTYANNWLKYASGTAVPSYIQNTYFGETRGMAESSWSVRPISHFTDESPGHLGPELIRDTDIESSTDWIEGSAEWTVDTVTDELIGRRPSAYCQYHIAGGTGPMTQFTSSPFKQVLTATLEIGKTYRLTFSILPPPNPPDFTAGVGSVTAEVYNGATVGVSASWALVGAKTVQFVATGAHDTVEFKMTSVAVAADGNRHQINKRLNYVSLREFVAI